MNLKEAITEATNESLAHKCTIHVNAVVRIRRPGTKHQFIETVFTTSDWSSSDATVYSITDGTHGEYAS